MSTTVAKHTSRPHIKALGAHGLDECGACCDSLPTHPLPHPLVHLYSPSTPHFSVQVTMSQWLSGDPSRRGSGLGRYVAYALRNLSHFPTDDDPILVPGN